MHLFNECGPGAKKNRTGETTVAISWSVLCLRIKWNQVSWDVAILPLVFFHLSLLWERLTVLSTVLPCLRKRNGHN